MPFSLDMFSDCEGLLFCVFQWANTVTNGLAMPMILVALCVVLFLATAPRFGVNRGFGFASVTGLFGGLFLSIMTLIPWWIGSLFVLLGGLGIVMMRLSER